MLRHLLSNPPPPIVSFPQWRAAQQAVHAKLQRDVNTWTADAALSLGFHSDSLGWAFLGGYQSAVHALLRGRYVIPSTACIAFCATEGVPGAPPKSIHSALEASTNPHSNGSWAPWSLNGSKSFVTMGKSADMLAVFVRVGESEINGKVLPDTRLVMVPSNRDGIEFHPPKRQINFIPEISHESVEFVGVSVGVEDVLPGNGYADYVKPFRTVEDVHVQLGLLGWLFRLHQEHGWPAEVCEQMLFVAHGLRSVVAALVEDLGGRNEGRKGDWLSLPTILAVEGANGIFRQLLQRIHADGLWDKVPDGRRAAWERDRKLFEVAARARAQRKEVARGQLGGAKL